jgi:hypothetical protein
MQVLTPTDIFALRTTNLLTVPQVVHDVIATMQLAPVAQVFTKKLGYKKPTAATANSWRTAALATFTFKKTAERVHDDPDYESVVGIINKVATSTVVLQSGEVLALLDKRKDDQIFRLRVVSLLFNRGVSMPFYSKLMASMFELIHAKLPIVKEDLQFSCSLEIFEKMFDQGGVAVCPSASDTEYEDKLCEWFKKKELRRGFGMFITELHVRGLVEEDVILPAITNTIEELEETIRKPTEKALSENVDQLTTFLYESTKIMMGRFGKTHPIVKTVSEKAGALYKIPKTDTPCLGMRSRFKLDDIANNKY